MQNCFDLLTCTLYTSIHILHAIVSAYLTIVGDLFYWKIKM